MANDINKWIGIGRLTRDAELKYLSSGVPVCKFSLAIGKKIKKNDEWTDSVSFIDVVLFGKSGESVNQYLTKGKQVAVEGELHQNRWEQEGQSRSKVEINANNVQLLGNKDAAEKPTMEKFTKDNPGVRQSATDSAPPDLPDTLPADFPDDIPV